MSLKLSNLYRSLGKRILQCQTSAVKFQPLKATYVSANSISDKASFPGYTGEFSTNLEFLYPDQLPKISCYRVLNRKGVVLDESQDPNLDKDTLVRMFKTMKTLSMLDTLMYESQRQGRISFYLTNHGESAAQIGSAAGLDSNDLVFAQYRESGVLLWRGFTIQQCIDQIYGNVGSSCKGKQMPIHYGSKDLAFVTISSTLATQMPQAVGAAYAYKRKKNGLCVICYFGDGAASEGDAHAAMNFSAVYDVPVIFFCRNNGYAISTPVKEQYRGDGIASRGSGYGIVTIRVDGNDLFAVYNATKAAREIAVKESRPVLIEAMTYRLGHHSTSDDSTAYRSIDEINSWEKDDNPISRFKNYLLNKNYISKSEVDELDKQDRQLILNAVAAAEKKRFCKPTEMFEDVFDKPSALIERQRSELLEHLKKNREHYPLESFEKMSKE